MSTIHYTNPAETTFTGSVFEFQFGAYGDTIVRVIHRPDHVDSALELAAEWLAENEPGHLITDDEIGELHREACRELFPRTPECELTEEQENVAYEHATIDITHTGSGHLTSYEWHVREMPEDEAFITPTFDRVDICQAYATYYASYHQGQGSHGYQRLSKALELCSPIRSFDELSENGQAIYRKLAISDGR